MEYNEENRKSTTSQVEYQNPPLTLFAICIFILASTSFIYSTCVISNASIPKSIVLDFYKFASYLEPIQFCFISNASSEEIQLHSLERRKLTQNHNDDGQLNHSSKDYLSVHLPERIFYHLTNYDNSSTRSKIFHDGKTSTVIINVDLDWSELVIPKSLQDRKALYDGEITIHIAISQKKRSIHHIWMELMGPSNLIQNLKSTLQPSDLGDLKDEMMDDDDELDLHDLKLHVSKNFLVTSDVKLCENEQTFALFSSATLQEENDGEINDIPERWKSYLSESDKKFIQAHLMFVSTMLYLISLSIFLYIIVRKCGSVHGLENRRPSRGKKSEMNTSSDGEDVEELFLEDLQQSNSNSNLN